MTSVLSYTVFDVYYLDGLVPQTVKLWQIPAHNMVEALEMARLRLDEIGITLKSPCGLQVVKEGAPSLDMLSRRARLWPEFKDDVANEEFEIVDDVE